jgi:hypothetical protein
MWAWLASFITGPLLSKAVGGIVDGYKAKLASVNTTEAHAIELAANEINGDIAARQVEASIIRQEQGWWVTALVRPLLALPFIVFTWKIVVWDKVLGWGSTDPLDPNMWSVFLTVVGAYFGGRTIEKVARIFKGR